MSGSCVCKAKAAAEAQAGAVVGCGQSESTGLEVGGARRRQRQRRLQTRLVYGLEEWPADRTQQRVKQQQQQQQYRREEKCEAKQTSSNSTICWGRESCVCQRRQPRTGAPRVQFALTQRRAFASSNIPLFYQQTTSPSSSPHHPLRHRRRPLCCPALAVASLLLCTECSFLTLQRMLGVGRDVYLLGWDVLGWGQEAGANVTTLANICPTYSGNNTTSRRHLAVFWPYILSSIYMTPPIMSIVPTASSAEPHANAHLLARAVHVHVCT